MTCRDLLALLVAASWLLSPGRSSTAEEAVRSTSGLQIPVSESWSGRLPAKSPSTTPAIQAFYLSQPEQSAGRGALPDPVPCRTLVQYALANNRQIQAARHTAWSLRARVPQAVSLVDPQLSTTTFLEAIQTAAGPYDLAVGLSQQFPWFGKLRLRGDVAYHDAMAAYARLMAVELRVIEEVKRAYFDLYYLQNAIRETRRLQPRLEDVIEIAKTKYETNVKSTGLEDVLQAQVELSKLKTRLVTLEQARIRAEAELAGVLHLPPQTRFTAEPNLDRSKLARTAQLLVELADSNQPELDARRREICRDRSATDLAGRDYWPDVKLGVTWYDIGSHGVAMTADGQDAFSMGVSANLPLYRTRLDAAVREARHKATSSVRQYAETLDRLHAEIEALYARFTEYDQVLTILEAEIIPRADQTLDLSIEAYRLGRQEFQQLIDVYRTLLEYRIDLHKQKALREQTIASLERAVGIAITSGATRTANDLEAVPAPPPQPAR